MDADSIALEIHEAIESASQIQPFSDRGIALSNGEAYRIARKLADLRGWTVVGRKIGFTNRSIWPAYSVDQPMWGVVGESTVGYAGTGPAKVDLGNFCEPRIEPEVVIGLGKTPPGDAGLGEIADCVDWVAPGFEIVHSIYPNWKFSIADTIAAGGLHGQLVVGRKFKPSGDVNQLLIDQRVALSRGDREIEKGSGRNVLDGPISALRYLIRGLADEDDGAVLKAGDIVTTGTLTDAKPVKAGEAWKAEYAGLMDASLEVEFS